jgi:hypothetical protein
MINMVVKVDYRPTSLCSAVLKTEVARFNCG